MKLVDDVIRQFSQRRFPHATRDFLEKNGLGRPRANVDVERTLKENINSGRIKPHDLVTFFHEQTLFTWKRVFVLKHDSQDVVFGAVPDSSQADLLVPNTDNRARRAPKSAFDSKWMPGFDIGPIKSDSFKGLEHRVLVTARSVTETLELDQSFLTDEGQKRFHGFKFQSKRDLFFQCFDVLVKVGSRTLLLVDAPPLTDAVHLQDDLYAYRDAVSGSGDLKDAYPYVDLWPAVESIYLDKKEGALNFIKFMSNGRSINSGAYGRLSTDDYRKHAYHRAGSKVGVVKVYALGVRWPEHGNAFASLPGKMHHIDRQLVNEVPFPPLERFETPFQLTAREFKLVANRIMLHAGIK